MVKYTPGKSGEYVLLRCKSPKCPHCSKPYQREVITALRIMFLKNRNLRMSMITLTLNNDHLTRDFKVLSSYWNKVKSRLNKSGFSNECDYIRVIEKGNKNGRLHAHILLIAPIESISTWINKICDYWIYGLTHFTIQNDKRGSLVNYVTGYMTKDGCNMKDHVGKISKSRHLSDCIDDIRTALDRHYPGNEKYQRVDDQYLIPIGNEFEMKKIFASRNFFNQKVREDISNGKINSRNLRKYFEKRVEFEKARADRQRRSST